MVVATRETGSCVDGQVDMTSDGRRSRRWYSWPEGLPCEGLKCLHDPALQRGSVAVMCLIGNGKAGEKTAEVDMSDPKGRQSEF